MKTYNINKVRMTQTSPQNAIDEITRLLNQTKHNLYICVSNVRTVTYANKNPDYLKVMDESYMNLPDGMPLVWMARLWGLKNVHRTTGPDLMVSILQQNNPNFKHFLLGDTEDTLTSLLIKYSNSNIVGTYSPPFCKLEDVNYNQIAKRINESGANIVWIALGAPKQDFVAHKLINFLDNKICIGVGAAFRFANGEMKHPPKIIKKLGLTGLYWRKKNLAKITWYSKHAVIISIWAVNILIKRFIKGELKK